MSTNSKTIFNARTHDGKSHAFYNYVKACEWLDNVEPEFANGTFTNTHELDLNGVHFRKVQHAR